jgi:hypothetical protein
MVQPRIHSGWNRCLHCSCTLAPPGPVAPPRWLRASASCTYRGDSAECQVQHSGFGTQGQGLTLSGTMQQLQQMSSGEVAQSAEHTSPPQMPQLCTETASCRAVPITAACVCQRQVVQLLE